MTSTKTVHFMIDKEQKGFKERFNCGGLRRSFRMIIGHKKDGQGLIALNLINSKLRKREESSGTVVQHGNGATQQSQQNCNSLQQHGAVLQQTELAVIAAVQQEPPPFLWVYSTSNNSLDCQVHHSQDLLVRPDSCDGIDGECKNGLRKNLRVKWNRLVKKKAHHEIYTIPAELRPQLKQIYVY